MAGDEDCNLTGELFTALALQIRLWRVSDGVIAFARRLVRRTSSPWLPRTTDWKSVVQ
jgi:hypothetical protein